MEHSATPLTAFRYWRVKFCGGQTNIWENGPNSSFAVQMILGITPMSSISLCLLDIKTADLFSSHSSPPPTTFFIWYDSVLPSSCQLFPLMANSLSRIPHVSEYAALSEHSIARQKIGIINPINHNFRDF